MDVKSLSRGCETDRPTTKTPSENPFAFPLVRSQTIGDLRLSRATPGQKDKKNAGLLDTLEEMSENGSTIKSKKAAFHTEPSMNAQGCGQGSTNAPVGGEKSKSMTNLKREGSRVHFTKSAKEAAESDSDNENGSDAESDVFSHASSEPVKPRDPLLPQDTVDLKRRLQRQRSIGSRRDIVYLRYDEYFSFLFYACCMTCFGRVTIIIK